MAISHEDAVKKLGELREKAEDLVRSYNEAYQSGKFDEVAKIDNNIASVVNEYTSVVRDDCFAACKNAESPMLAAVTMLSFMTIGVKDAKKEGDLFPIRTVVDKERQIDLYKLHKYCGGDGIGADPKWVYIVEQLNMQLTAKKARDLGLDPKEVSDSFAMSNIAKAIDLGKDPTSNTNLLKTLQTVITAMLGDGYKATSHDVKFLMSVYSKKSRQTLTVTTANNRSLRGYLAEICHRIVTNGKYAIEYKKVK